ncbi:1,3-1,4-beta-glycanase [Sinorhizobium americanum]|uniref:1,3-1,4-beta-glycanase n=1 Tax=Sinorhizobium americanum TaxID=194963 RepID=A0A2S3YS64_9HYPH|nr:1,3-1,4-beta-glycanase [Sinorhizobium sp. FG01]PDT53039.1 1,3-1,4-beta-glycanase [Sinorhizobium sp. NG07B]POH29207.1 1,3-1,4-beta-glycanase [Sinorhizobium americanum]POH34492.1 1,3-1,4-beta-glycanase [Sinorhizobium americanum]
MFSHPRDLGFGLNRRFLIRRLASGLLACALASTFPGPVPAEGVAGSDTGDELSLDRMETSFDESFDTLSVSAWGPDTRWIAHTPWSGDFGGARFANPEAGYPFTTEDGILRIEARRDDEGKWTSGLLASVDPKGKGFAQQYGYFEMRARLPTGAGVWPAFWLIGKDRSKATAEIDVLEFYGDKPDGYSSVVHVWHRDGRHDSQFKRIDAFAAGDPGEFHTYGVKVDAEFIRMYFDRRLVWKASTRPEHRQPMFILLNLALVESTADDAPDPSHMYVDYVRAYRFR